MRIGLTVATSLAVVGCLVLAVSMPARAQVNMYDGNWHFTAAPYVWLPTINTTIGLTGVPGAGGSLSGGNVPSIPGSVNIQIGPNSYLSNLNFALLGYFEARKGLWSVFTDVIYMDASNQSASVISLGGRRINVDLNTGTNARLQTLLGTLALSRTLARTDTATLDAFAGVRYLGAQATANWSLSGSIGAFSRSGSVSQSADLWDGVAGIKGQVRLGRDSRWFVPYYLDAGTGAFTTWQASAGIGYSFSWGDVVLNYRHMYLDVPGGLLQDTTLSGPMLGVAFHW
jgi:hypothetical protein